MQLNLCDTLFTQVMPQIKHGCPLDTVKCYKIFKVIKDTGFVTRLLDHWDVKHCTAHGIFRSNALSHRFCYKVAGSLGFEALYNVTGFVTRLLDHWDLKYCKMSPVLLQGCWITGI